MVEEGFEVLLRPSQLVSGAFGGELVLLKVFPVNIFFWGIGVSLGRTTQHWILCQLEQNTTHHVLVTACSPTDGNGVNGSVLLVQELFRNDDLGVGDSSVQEIFREFGELPVLGISLFLCVLLELPQGVETLVPAVTFDNLVLFGRVTIGVLELFRVLGL